jgi:hypothetical protein
MAAQPRIFGGRLSTDDQLWIERETRTRCGRRTMRGPTSEWPTEHQIDRAAALAIDLYATAGGHDISREQVNAVTSFIDAAIDAIRAKDRAT